MIRRDEATEPADKRSAAWAVACSLAVPGLGHWYLGAIRQALAIAALYLLTMPTLVVSIVALDRGFTLAMWAVIGAGWSVRALAAIHAGVVAKRMRPFEASKFHSLGAYMGFVVAVVTLGQIVSETLRKHVLETSAVPAISGRPSIESGDHLVVTKLAARDREARRGDLITFKAPGEPAIFVKRVVAVEGEAVSVEDGVVSVDGLVFATSPCASTAGLVVSDGSTCVLEWTPEGVSYPILTRPSHEGAAPVLVPPGHVFVLGDNRPESHDSRHFGSVDREAVTGRARAVWWPHARARSLDP